MSTRELQERLLLAAARAYIQARLSNTPIPCEPAQYARMFRQATEAFSAHEHEWQGIEITLPLGDVLAAVKGLEEGESYRGRYENEKKGLDSWIAAWPKVIEAWRAGKRPSSILKMTRTNAVDYDAIARRVELLTQGYTDPDTGQVYPPMLKDHAVKQVASELSKTTPAIYNILREIEKRAGFTAS